MSTIPLPERPNLEQLKKQAKLLQRSVRAGHPKAIELVAEHCSEGTLANEKFPLDSAQLVLARGYGFSSWRRLRQHVESLVLPPEEPEQVTGGYSLTVENRYHARPGWAADQDIERCAGACGGSEDWRPILTAHYMGVKVIAFATPAGPVFCELTPTTITVSKPSQVTPPPGKATLLFHTPFGTMAGVVGPDVTSVSLERPTDLMAREGGVVLDGIFVVPNAFTVTSTGLVLRVNGNRTSDIIPVNALPSQAVGTVDRPAPPAERESPAGQRLAAAIALSDTPPAVDPAQWAPGVCLELTDTEQVQLARYGNLLAWDKPDPDYAGLYVFDFGPQQGPLRPFAVVGTTLAATRMYYGFRDNHSDTVAVLGLVYDDSVASITLSRNGKPDTEAVLGGGTFIMTGPALVGLGESGAGGTRLTTRDSAGNVLEDLAYREDLSYRRRG